MFVVSVSSGRLRKYIAFLSAFMIVASAILSVGLFVESDGDDGVFSGDAGYSLAAGSPRELLAFISQFGWEVEGTPVEIADVAIPESFDDVYDNYNSIQLAQGLDLSNYAGVAVKRWSYRILNYPDYPEGTDYIRINILVYDGRVIGGDVCSLKLDGFMHGFEKE